MPKKKSKKSLNKRIKKFFGNKLDFWDILIITILGIYIYGVFHGWGGSWWRVFDLFAGGLFFFFIVRRFNEFLKKKQKN